MIFPSVTLEATVLTVIQLLPQTEPCKAQCFTRPPGTFVNTLLQVFLKQSPGNRNKPEKSSQELERTSTPLSGGTRARGPSSDRAGFILSGNLIYKPQYRPLRKHKS